MNKMLLGTMALLGVVGLSMLMLPYGTDFGVAPGGSEGTHLAKGDPSTEAVVRGRPSTKLIDEEQNPIVRQSMGRVPSKPGSFEISFVEEIGGEIPVRGVRCTLTTRDPVTRGVDRLWLGSSDASGRILFCDLLANRYYLDTEFFDTKGIGVTPEKRSFLQVKVPSIARIRVEVVGPDGEPIAGAEVYVSERSRVERVRKIGVTGEGGVLEVEGRFRTFLSSRKKGYAASALVYVSGDQPRPLRFQLGESKSFSGMVYGQGNRPVRNAEIIAGTKDPGWARVRNGRSIGRRSPARTTRSKEDGTFVLADIPTDVRVPLAIRADGYGCVSIPFSFKLEYEIHLTPERPVRGRIDDDSGRALSGVRVTWGDPNTFQSAESVTDSSGFFELRGVLDSEKIDIRARRTGYEPVVARVPASFNRVYIRLAKVGR